ncbi:S-layer homology domain-containing protein [Robertmurraya sp. FSL W8-0741]|uniref:S-layer homology domain-containing protein n=1 Tax=Robertmurraya sp. FSL W8-0741 TaxID=2954629 RepID=UPI0030FA4E3E
MKKFAKNRSGRVLIASAIAAGFLIMGVQSASAQPFTDVSAKYAEAVGFLTENGAQGLTERTFGVNEEIKRVDAAVLIANTLQLDTDKAPESGFTDVPKRAQGAVNALKAQGITSGKTNTSFGSANSITRGELALWLQRGFQLTGKESEQFTDVSPRYKTAVSALLENRITNGISNHQFGTNKPIKRGDFSILAYKSFIANQYSKVQPLELKSINGTTVQVKIKGKLTIARPSLFQFTGGLDVKEARIIANSEETIVELTTSLQKPGETYKLTVFGLLPVKGELSFTTPPTTDTPTNPGNPGIPGNPGNPGGERPGGSYTGNDFSGTAASPKIYNGDVTVNLANIATLSHSVVKGNLTLSGTAAPNLTLTNITVEGDLDLSKLSNAVNLELTNVTVAGETTF